MCSKDGKTFRKVDGNVKLSSEKEVLNLQQEISNLKKDIRFLSKKGRIQDLYLNRLNKEKEEVLHTQKYSAEEKMKNVMNPSKWESNGERQKFLLEMFNESIIRKKFRGLK
ncbi:hypothetical protein GJU40_17195 [Bacillus lacus]|uniref:Uncharacterized protein n=1 Tax=Metabacillus lacus TaxID=1983721 RepID=A0A7X2J3B1_9BACI|nr:hypothetical protein [Metabacillus lacus]MRX73873.1 hypothetical protein [Metabacillus lacus]